MNWMRLIPPIFYPSLRTLLINILRIGPLPNHVGFIMDGNRRFSRLAGLPIELGHLAGFDALKRILELLLRLKVPNVTVYAFAIGNFNRSPEEVNKLMNLARDKLVQICEKGQLLDRYGIRVVVIGRKDLLPIDIQESVTKIEQMTAHNNRGCLNVAFPYSSQEEIATAICKTVQDSITHRQPASSITIDTIDKNLYTSHSPPLDILVRTSGVSRLSDFLLWQSTLNSTKYQSIQQSNPEDLNLLNLKTLDEFITADDLNHNNNNNNNNNNTGKKKKSMIRDTIKGPSIHFVPKFWPDFGLLDVLPILLGWQAEEFFNRFLYLFSSYPQQPKNSYGI